VFESVALDAVEVVRACVENHRSAADGKRITLQAHGGEAPGAAASVCRMRADREGLREILDNLLDNAIKYTPEGGGVSVVWRSNGSMAQIAVRDSGIGIRPEDQQRIFERFYRVDKARSRELGGTGLGLSIVKHLAQSMNGTVAVESEVGRGSTFTVELPAG
jgi:two-component system phosphate regulon sensor histidine kinase PhoR